VSAAADVEGVRLDVAERHAVYLWELGDGRFARVSATAHQLLQLRAQGVSFDEIALRLGGSDGAWAATTHAALLARLDELRRRPRKDRAFLLRVRVLSAARVQAIARRLAPLYRRTVALPVVLLSLAAIAWSLRRGGLPPATPAAAAIGYALFVASLFVHELGHASASAWFGRPPSEIGAALYLVYPAFYSDVSQAWALRRGARVIVDLGGVYFQLACIAALAVGWRATGSAALGVAAWMSLMSAAVSLNPIFRFDGYWVLSDLIGVANLDSQPLRLLGIVWSRLLGRPAPRLQWARATTAAVAIYGVVSQTIWAAFAISLGPMAWREAHALGHAIAALGAHHAVGDLVAIARAALVLVAAAWLLARLVGIGVRALRPA
jgi:putative peptide zinc metalloprotease protein